MTNFMTALEMLYKRSKYKDHTKYGNPQKELQITKSVIMNQ